MRSTPHIPLLFAMVPAFFASALPQTIPDAPHSVTPSPAAGATSTSAAPTIELLKSSIRVRYSESAWAEELTLELTPSGSPPRRTTVRIACDPSPAPEGESSPVRPAIRLQLDALTIVATPSRLTAISADAPDVAYEAPLSPSRPLIDQLREIVPSLPFPQIHLALIADPDQSWASAIASVAPTAGTDLHERLPGPDDVSGVVLLSTRNPVQTPDEAPSTSEFQARILPDRGGFIEISARDTFGTTPGTLRITCKPLDPPAPDAFSLDLASRQRVDSLARLRPPEPEIKAGMRLPALGLVDDTLALWSPQAAFDAQRSPRNTPIRLALVFYDATQTPGANTPSQADDAFDACLLVRGLADKYRRDEASNDRAPRPEEEDPLPRVGVVPVAVFDIAAFSPLAVRDEAIAWSELGTPGAFTSAGQPLLKRFNPSGGVSIVVIDEGQIVRGVVPWQGRTSAQRRDDLDKALRGVLAPRPNTDQPAPPPPQSDPSQTPAP